MVLLRPALGLRGDLPYRVNGRVSIGRRCVWEHYGPLIAALHFTKDPRRPIWAAPVIMFFNVVGVDPGTIDVSLVTLVAIRYIGRGRPLVRRW